MRGLILTLALFGLVSPGLMAQDAATALPAEAKESCLISQPNGCIDWEHGIIYATGMGVPNPDLKSAAQKTYSAHQAALVVAKRNLLGMVEEIQISSSQTVQMGMLESDVIKTEIHGSLKQVSEVGKPKVMGDGSTWVTVKMHMRDIMNALVKNEGFDFGDAPVEKSTVSQAKPLAPSETLKAGGEVGTIYTGLILDARGTGVKPAMSPKLYSASGEEIYGSFLITRQYALEFGVAAYVKDLDKAQTSDRVKGKPLLLKASLQSNAKQADLKLSNEDAELLKELNKTQTFLREARVVILL